MGFVKKVFARDVSDTIEEVLSFLKLIAIVAVAGGMILYTLFSWIYTFVKIVF